MPSSEEDGRTIDQALQAWCQGDVSLDVGLEFLHFADLSRPHSLASAQVADDLQRSDPGRGRSGRPEAAPGRCHQYLTKNLALGMDAFKPLGALLLAKLFDETQPVGNGRFWIRGEEPFDAGGQRAIRERIAACFEDARAWQPDVLLHGWDLGHLDAAQMAYQGYNPLVTIQIALAGRAVENIGE